MGNPNFVTALDIYDIFAEAEKLSGPPRPAWDQDEAFEMITGPKIPTIPFFSIGLADEIGS